MKAVVGSALLLALASGAGGSPQEGPSGGFAIERTVTRTSLDWLGRREEVRRRERVLLKGRKAAIQDLTFGERLIIRGDLRKLWRADPLAKEYSEFTFDQAAGIRKSRLDEIRAAKARVPGTSDEKELVRILEGFDQFAAAPQVTLRSEGSLREVIVNGDLVRISVQVNERFPASGWLEALAGIDAFHPAVAEKLKGLGGLPVSGTIRYTLFLERITEQFEVTQAGPREIDDADFELPAGLVRTPLKGFERPPERTPPRPPALKSNFKEDEGEKPKAEGADPKGKP